MSGMDVYNFLYMVSSVGGSNSNTACLREEVDNLMEMDEKLNLIRLGKKQNSINLIKMDEAADHHLREEVDLMEMDKSNLILLGKKQKLII